MDGRQAIRRYRAGGEYFFLEGCYINELSNSPDDPGVSIARARVEPGRTTRWHCLRTATERYVILSGTGVVEVGEAPPSPVAHCDVVLIPPGVRQRIANVGRDDLVFLAICSPRFQKDDYVDCDE